MRVSKFLTIAFFITVFSLLYVYQQTQIFRLAYVGQKKLALLEDLSETNSFFKYSVEKNTSVVKIGAKISSDVDFQMPSSFRLVRMGLSEEKAGSTVKTVGALNFLAKFFSIKRQAEARTLLPSVQIRPNTE